MTRRRWPICLMLLLGSLGCAFAAPELNRVGAASFALDSFQGLSSSPVRVQGVVTLIDPARQLLVLQDGTNVVALNVKLPGQDVQVGDWIKLEGKLGPLIPACPDFPDAPDRIAVLDSFEAPTNAGEATLTKMVGYLRLPVTGEYTFWIASDDSSELWLSDSANPDQARQIAEVPTGQWTRPHQWTKMASQQSAGIRLEAGKSYYIEAREQNTRSANSLAVAWEGPGLKRSIIGGTYLASIPIENNPAHPTTNQGVVWEYWTNFFPCDLSILRKPVAGLLKCREARVLKRVAGVKPVPLRISSGQTLGSDADFRLVFLEARVAFVSRENGQCVMELSHGKSRITARIKSGFLSTPVLPNRSLVRVEGVFEPAHSFDTNASSGTLWVNDGKDVTWLDNNENWSVVEMQPQWQLTSANRRLTTGRIIHSQGRVVGREAADLWRLKGKDTVLGYTSADGTNWQEISAPVEISMSNTVLAGFAMASYVPNATAEVAFDQVSGLATQLSGVEIGAPPIPGTFNFKSGKYIVQGSGNQMWSIGDQCYFAAQPATGNLEITAHLTNFKSADSFARAAIMLRESTDTNSPWAGVLIMSANRVALMSRWEKGGYTAGQFLFRRDNWFRLIRRQNSFLIHAPDASLNAGQMLDVLGEVQWQGDRLVLDRVRTKPIAEKLDLKTNTVPSPEEAPYGKARRVRIAQLGAEAKKSQRVAHRMVLQIQGVMTFNAEIGGEWLSFVQDASGGMRVQWWGNSWRDSVHAGDLVQLTGAPEFAGSVPEFFASGVTRLGTSEMPEPARISLSRPTDEEADGKWTELEGVVRSVRPDGKLLVMSPAGPVELGCGSSHSAQLSGLVNARIRARGVLWHFPKPMLLLPAERFLEVIEAPPADPFSIPTYSIQSLETNENAVWSARRTKVSGVVTCQRDDFVMVQDNTGGIRVETGAVTNLQIGDRVEAVGFLAQQEEGWALSRALVRSLGAGRIHKPMEISSKTLNVTSNNGELVSIEAVLLAQHVGGSVQALDVQCGQRAFRASLPRNDGHLPAIAAGSRVRLTGVAVMKGADFSSAEPDSNARPLLGSLELLLRGPNDVTVIQRPPWWNWKYTAGTSAFVVLVFIGALIWIRMLRRRVEQRTQQLRETMDKLQAETQISATLAERDRLAGEIHDSIEQGLSAIMMQMEAAAKLVSQPEEIKRYLTMAKNMAGFSRAEVQHVVWDMQSPLLENADLPTALRRVAQDISVGDTPRVTVEVSGVIGQLPSSVEHHLLRIAQEAITNAVKHGNARTISLVLKYDSDAVTLTIQDDGSGFVPESVSTQGGHFGLQGMRTRAQKIDAVLSLDSVVGKGTCIQVIVQKQHHAAPNSTY